MGDEGFSLITRRVFDSNDTMRGSMLTVKHKCATPY